MNSFIFTIEASATKTSQLIDITHWTINVKDSEEADATINGRIVNLNRTIKSVHNRVITREMYKRGVCSYIDRNLQCVGHPLNKQ